MNAAPRPRAGVARRQTSDAHANNFSAHTAAAAVGDDTTLSTWLSTDGDRITAHVGNGHREAKASVGAGRECISAIVEQRHLLAARQAGHRAADVIDVGRAADLNVGDVRDRRRTHTTAVRD
ncbi:hypothetical protein D3C87_1445420 [compost metagenome]